MVRGVTIIEENKITGDFGQQVGLYQIGDISHVIVVPYPKNTDTYANIPTTYNGGPR